MAGRIVDLQGVDNTPKIIAMIRAVAMESDISHIVFLSGLENRHFLKLLYNCYFLAPTPAELASRIMSTSLLYHAFGIRGYQYVSTQYQKGEVLFQICQRKTDLNCPPCGSWRFIRKCSV